MALPIDVRQREPALCASVFASKETMAVTPVEERIDHKALQERVLELKELRRRGETLDTFDQDFLIGRVLALLTERSAREEDQRFSDLLRELHGGEIDVGGFLHEVAMLTQSALAATYPEDVPYRERW